MTGIINEDNEADSLNCCVHRLGESLMYLWWLFLSYIGRCIQLFSFDCVSWRVSENQFWSNWLMRYLAARPQHRASARRRSYAEIGTVHKCVVHIGIGETTHQRGDISAHRSCWRPAHAPLTTSWPMQSGNQFQIWRYFLQYELQLRPVGKHKADILESRC